MIIRKRPLLYNASSGLVLTRAPVAPQLYMGPPPGAGPFLCYVRVEAAGNAVVPLTVAAGQAVSPIGVVAGNAEIPLTVAAGDAESALVAAAGEAVTPLTEDVGNLNLGKDCT